MTWGSTHPAAAGAADHARLRELGYKQELKRHLSYGAVQLLHLLLHHLGADGGDHAVQHGAGLRRARNHDPRLVPPRRLHHGRRPLHGRDLLRLPHLRRPLLLERAPRRPPLGALRVLDHRMVQHCRAVGRHSQRRLLARAADPGDRLAQHRRDQRRRVRRLQVRRLRVPRRDPAQPRRHQQPLHRLAVLLRPAGRCLEHDRCLCSDDRRAARRHREGQCQVRLHPFQHRQQRRDPQQVLHLHPGAPDEPVHADRIRRVRAPGTEQNRSSNTKDQTTNDPITVALSVLHPSLNRMQTEETKTAAWNGPIGIVSSIGISLVVGWGYILGVTFAVRDVPYLLSPDNDAGGYAIAEVFYLAFKGRYGSGAGGIACLGVVAVAIYFCGMSSVTSNSRMTYAFSRDGAMPFSSVWHKVNKHEVPINAVWLSAFVSLCMALPSLGSLVAFQAMASVSTTALCIAYALPILFRVTLARRSFVEGPFSLGRYSTAVGWAAVLWVATITVLFSLPVAYPVTKDTLNYTPVAVGGLFALVLSSWIAGAQRWFKGPVTNLDGKGGVELL